MTPTDRAASSHLSLRRRWGEAVERAERSGYIIIFSLPQTIDVRALPPDHVIFADEPATRV